MDVLIFIHATSFIYSGLAACECKKLKKKKDGCCQIINYYVTAHSPAHHSGPLALLGKLDLTSSPCM
jgi:hypothetical protein